MLLPSVQRGLRIGAIAFGILTYLILVGVPLRLGDLAFPVLAGVMALFFWLALRGGGHSHDLRLFAGVGLLGGFTTFSAFSLELMAMLERGRWGLALAYAGMSVVLAVAALALGLAIMRALVR